MWCLLISPKPFLFKNCILQDILNPRDCSLGRVGYQVLLISLLVWFPVTFIWMVITKGVQIGNRDLNTRLKQPRQKYVRPASTA
jgi:hypothetical protein